MAGSVSIGKGSDPGYYTRQAARGPDYYAGPAGSGGKPATEPPGTWAGDGLADLGLSAGAIVDHEAFAKIFGEHVDPRTGERIGRTLKARDAEKIYGSLLESEPGATAERRRELFAQAQATAAKSQPVLFYDATCAVSKSITLLHASARAMELEAVAAGDAARAAQARAIQDSVWGAIKEGADASLAYLQREAGFTRTGAGGVRQEDAHRWVASQWRQHSSRAGDPHLHVHQPILNKVVTGRDGVVRTIDGKRIYAERPGAAAAFTAVTENALARDLGVEYVMRADGHGREIKGVPQAMIDEFSSRARQDIEPRMLPLIEAYRQEWGHDPDEAALWSMSATVALDTRQAKRDVDPVTEVREWAERARAKCGAELAPLALQVCGVKSAAKSAAKSGAEPEAKPGGFGPAQRLEVTRRGVAAIQAKRSAFGLSDLARAIQEQLPADLPVMGGAEAAALPQSLARLALEKGMIVALEAPAIFSEPASLRRASGESVYYRTGETQYSTDAQLVREARILRTMADRGAPSANPDRVAELLGADRADLERQLDPLVPADVTTRTGSGLLLSQAAAAYAIMTSDRRTDVLVGPAGTGKSTVIAKMAELWPQLHPGSRFIGLTETQAGANVLRTMGVADAHNVSMFLTDPRLHGEIPAGSVIMTDEGSMVTMAHLDALAELARKVNAKMPMAGDHAQHQAVQQGGGMAMAARKLGTLQLNEALRFSQEWERAASLRLRAGDQAVLPLYEEHGRIMAGGREQVFEDAYRRWLADALAGRESVLVTRENADALELSRRARADLIRYGQVEDGATARLRDGVPCSAGDRIMARKNRHAEGLANRQVYQVLEVRPDGSVTAALTSDGTVRALSAAYLAAECHSAYAVTSHSAEGATFSGFGYAIGRVTDNREFCYTSMTRGASGNFMFMISSEPERATDRNQAAPEVARARQLARERDGTSAGPGLQLTPGTGLLAQVLARTDADMSATETMERSFSDADSLRTLKDVWQDLAGREYSRRYEAELSAALGSDAAQQVTSDYKYTWLCRTLRAGEMAGMDGREVLAEALAQGSLEGSRSMAAVLDKRCRDIIPVTVPLAGGWAARTPEAADPDADALLADVARAMDDRTGRLGEHVAATMPLWAREMGDLPEEASARAEWVARAGAVAASREISDWQSPTKAIGDCPDISMPLERGAWHEALSALSRTDGIDLSALSDEELEIRRRAYERETARAPAHVGRELMLSRMAGDQAELRAGRSRAEAEIAADPEVRARHEAHAARWGSLAARAREAEALYAEAQEARDAWHRIADQTLRSGQAADLESRRRSPWSRKAALRNAEPDSGLTEGKATDAQRLAAIGLNPEQDALSDHPRRLADAGREHLARLAELAALPEPHAGDEERELVELPAWGADAVRQREAVSQPPEILVEPSARLAGLDFEAG